MTANVVAASPQATLAEIVALMRRHNIKRIPILTNGRLSGIVSRRDVLKAISATPDPVARGDDALRLAVSTRLQAEFGLRREKVEVNVRDSVVNVIGGFESDAACEAVRIVTEAIAGASCIVTRKARPTAASWRCRIWTAPQVRIAHVCVRWVVSRPMRSSHAKRWDFI